MNNRRFSPIVILALLLLSQVSLAAGINFQNLTLEEGIAKAKKENKKLFIDVFATWCGPCKYLDKNTFTDMDLGGFINEHYIALKLDGEQTDGESLMFKFDLDAFPTMLFLDADLKLLKKVIGSVEAHELLTKAKDVIFPEEAELYKLRIKYEVGVRSREFIHELVNAAMSEEEPFDDYISEYLKLYHDLDLYNESDYFMFHHGITDLESAQTTFFIDNISALADVHYEAVTDKLGLIFYQVVLDAVDKEDHTFITQKLDVLYEPYAEVFYPDAMEKSVLLEALLSAYEEEVAD